MKQIGIAHLITPPAWIKNKQHEQLFLLDGIVHEGALREIRLGPGVTLPPAPQQEKRLRVLHFNDSHGRLTSLTRNGREPHFSRLAGFVHKVRREHRQDPDTSVLLLSAGDDQIGSQFDYLLGTTPTNFRCHAPYRLYSQAGVDLATIGNHDLDLGSGLLRHAMLQDARFPLLSANLVFPTAETRWHFPAALLVSKGLRIGIIGITTTAQLHHLPGDTYQMIDPLQAVQNILPALRPFCDLLIILSHLGYSAQSSAIATVETGDIQLAEQLPPASVDLIVGGHTHHVLNSTGLCAENIVNGIPIVQAGAMGNFLGDVTLKYTPGQPMQTSACLHAINAQPVDEIFEKLYVTPLVNMLEPLLSLPIGTITPHEDCTETAVKHQFAGGESALANFMTDAIISSCKANGLKVDLAAIDQSAVHSGLPDCRDLTLADCYNLMPYADHLVVYVLSGEQLHALVADNVQRWAHPGRSEKYRGFFHFSRELRYEVFYAPDEKKWRLGRVLFGGAPLSAFADRTFHLATTSFSRHQVPKDAQDVIAESNGQPPFDLSACRQIPTSLFFREAMVDVMMLRGGITAENGLRRDGRFHIIPPPDQTST
jgi:5'-nucleotidase/UDP-sugar diphosphatase